MANGIQYVCKFCIDKLELESKFRIEYTCMLCINTVAKTISGSNEYKKIPASAIDSRNNELNCFR